jgi:hypothetical protein
MQSDFFHLQMPLPVVTFSKNKPLFTPTKAKEIK